MFSCFKCHEVRAATRVEGTVARYYDAIVGISDVMWLCDTLCMQSCRFRGDHARACRCNSALFLHICMLVLTADARAGDAGVPHLPAQSLCSTSEPQPQPQSQPLPLPR